MPGGSASWWAEQLLCWSPSPSLVTRGNYLVGLLFTVQTHTHTHAPFMKPDKCRPLLVGVCRPYLLVFSRLAEMGGVWFPAWLDSLVSPSTGSQEFAAKRVSEAHQMSDGSQATASDPQFGKSVKDMPRSDSQAEVVFKLCEDEDEDEDEACQQEPRCRSGARVLAVLA